MFGDVLAKKKDKICFVPYTEEEFPPGGFLDIFHMKHDVPMNPGLEPILLDLENLFLIPDEGKSRK